MLGLGDRAGCGEGGGVGEGGGGMNESCVMDVYIDYMFCFFSTIKVSVGIFTLGAECFS